jgi:hypothetical protein
MKTLPYFSLYLTPLLAALFILFLSSCEDDATYPTDIFYGPSLPLGGGAVRSVVKLDAHGHPSAIGVTFPEATFTGLPHAHTELVLELPAQASATSFRHITLDWNPHGHEPEHIYDLPHFDLHFYTISAQERMQIGVDDPNAEKLPAEQYIPAGYVPGPGYVPQMGKHWLDPTSPEFNGGTFTQTFLMGSYNEKMIFWEPMITLDYLLEKKTETFSLAQPQAYEQQGKYYPTKYSIEYDAASKTYTINLLELRLR